MSAKVIATKIPEKMKTETEGKTDPDKRDEGMLLLEH